MQKCGNEETIRWWRFDFGTFEFFLGLLLFFSFSLSLLEETSSCVLHLGDALVELIVMKDVLTSLGAGGAVTLRFDAGLLERLRPLEKKRLSLGVFTWPAVGFCSVSPGADGGGAAVATGVDSSSTLLEDAPLPGNRCPFMTLHFKQKNYPPSALTAPLEEAFNPQYPQ